MSDLYALTNEMINYYSGDPARIQHFLKVHSFALLIGTGENLDENELFILETAALTHDIGIKPAEEKFGSSAGKYQEQEGPAVAAEMLGRLGFEQKIIDRVCYLIGHHHTYDNMDGADYQILVEADFLVNLYEEKSSRGAVLSAYNKIFRTKTGRRICRRMFDIEE